MDFFYYKKWQPYGFYTNFYTKFVHTIFPNYKRPYSTLYHSFFTYQKKPKTKKWIDTVLVKPEPFKLNPTDLELKLSQQITNEPETTFLADHNKQFVVENKTNNGFDFTIFSDIVNSTHEYTAIFFFVTLFVIIAILVMFLPTPSATLFNRKHNPEQNTQKTNNTVLTKSRSHRFSKQRLKKTIVKKK